ncbi:hypothetical protein Glove_60g108 [Diversispora epigaea]|uniref:Uncharacterized protein n=1 Tax=Diversispora epigaea TaxID=1348612 RepID=A0A397JCM9_9GLOM|nr:hypothetical protein Glove_60g108 [Diversispora epigaea]
MNNSKLCNNPRKDKPNHQISNKFSFDNENNDEEGVGDNGRGRGRGEINNNNSNNSNNDDDNNNNNNHNNHNNNNNYNNNDNKCFTIVSLIVSGINIIHGYNISDMKKWNEEIRHEICLRLLKFMNTILCLEKVLLQPSSSEYLVKYLQRVYKILVALTKYIKNSEAGEIKEHFIESFDIFSAILNYCTKITELTLLNLSPEQKISFDCGREIFDADELLCQMAENVPDSLETIKIGMDYYNPWIFSADSLRKFFERWCCKRGGGNKKLRGLRIEPIRQTKQISPLTLKTMGEHFKVIEEYEIQFASLAGYIQTKALPYIGSWIQFPPAIISNLCNDPIEQPQPMLSTHTQAFSKWTMPMPHLNGIYNLILICQDPGIKNLKLKLSSEFQSIFYWEWPIEASLAGYIQTKALPYIGSWIQFPPAIISNLCNDPIEQPQPMLSTHTQAFSKWTMPMPHLNGIYNEKELEKNDKKKIIESDEIDGQK